MNRPLHAIAAEFCSWVEKREMQEDVGVWLSRILAELIHVVYCIPDDGLWDAGADEENGYKGRDYQEVRNSLPNLPLQYYREVYDSTVLDDNDPVNGELHDDVADIYGDLKRGLFVHENISPAEAERYWRQSFRYHWGEHATGALRALYWHETQKCGL